MTLKTTKAHLRKKSDIHWERKLWHIFGVLAMVTAFVTLPYATSMGILAMVCAVFIPVDLLRQSYPRFNELVIQIFRPLLREHEARGLAGTTWLLTGVLLIALIFPMEIVTLTLLFLALADPIASYVGIRFGRDKLLGNKSLQGFMAAFVVCTCLSVAYFFHNNLMMDRIYLVAPLAGLMGALSELLPIGKLDDNLSLPVLSASSLWLIFYLFGGISLYG